MKYKMPFVTLIAVLVLAACGAATPAAGEPTTDVAAVRTSAASTVISQFTLTAAVFTPVVAAPTDTQAPESSPAPEATATQTTLPVAQVTNAEGTVVDLCDKYS